MKYKAKFKLKKFWYSILGILTIVAILILGLLQEKIFEMIISIICFYSFSPLFEKQYHSKSLYKCSGISIIIFFILNRITLNISSSILFTIVLTFALTSASYFIRDLLDKTVLLKYYTEKAEQFKNIPLENASLDELKEKLVKLNYDIIEIVYGYLHRPKHIKAVGYARKCNIAVSTLYKYLKIVKNEWENLD
jgi:hypothetical protein